MREYVDIRPEPSAAGLKDGHSALLGGNFTYFAEFVSNTIISIDQCQIRFKIHICIMIALLRSYFKHSYLLNINYMDPSPIENHEKRNEE